MRTALLAVAVIVGSYGCSLGQCPPAAEVPPAQRQSLASRYDYQVPQYMSLVLQLNVHGEVQEYQIKFRTPLPSGTAANDIAGGFLYRPAGPGPYPGVALVPRFGSDQAGPERWLARELARRGFTVFVVMLPWHMKRRGEAPGGFDMLWRADVEKLAEAVRQAVIDTRRTLEWLGRQGDVHVRRLAVVGVGSGAFISNLVLALDKQPVTAVSILGGGDIAHAVWHGPFALWQWWQLRQRGWTEPKLAEFLTPYDPLTFAHPGLAPRLYMINGRFDLLVPRCSTERLWQAAGRPPITWLPSGHFTAYLWRQRVLELTASHLTDKLLPLPPAESN